MRIVAYRGVLLIAATTLFRIRFFAGFEPRGLLNSGPGAGE